jgi:hypothetical protein
MRGSAHNLWHTLRETLLPLEERFTKAIMKLRSNFSNFIANKPGLCVRWRPALGLVYRSDPGINNGIRNGIQYHISLVSHFLILPLISLYFPYWINFFLAQSGTQQTFLAFLITKRMETFTKLKLNYQNTRKLSKGIVGSIFLCSILIFSLWNRGIFVFSHCQTNYFMFAHK